MGRQFYPRKQAETTNAPVAPAKRQNAAAALKQSISTQTNNPMSYITTNDLNLFLDEREIAALKRDKETDGTDKIPVGISYAENYVKDRLSNRYDIGAEYAKTGDKRNTTLLEVLAHIAIWKLCATFPTVQLDNKRHYNYEQALNDLKQIAKGDLCTNLPINDPTASTPIFGTSTNFDVNY